VADKACILAILKVCGFYYILNPYYVYKKMKAFFGKIKTGLWIVAVLFFLSESLCAQSKNSSYRSSNGSLIREYLDSAQYLASRAPFRAIDKINKAIELSLNENDKNNEGLSYWILGNIQQNLDQHELAADNYRKSIASLATLSRSKKMSQYSSPESLATLFKAYKHLTISLLQLHKTSEAVATLSNCFESRFQAIPEKEKLDANRVQVDILVKQKKQEEAFKLLNSILEREKKLNNGEGEAKTWIAIGTLYEATGDEDKAIDAYTHAKSIAEKTKNSALLLTVNNLMAKIFRQQKNTAKELEVRNSNIASFSDKYKEASQQNKEIGNAYLNTREVDKALPFFEKSLSLDKTGNVIIPRELFGKSNELETTANTYKLLAEAYLKRGDTEKALRYLEVFVEIQDSIKSIRKRELNEALKLSNQIGKNQQRIGLLEKERNLSEKSIEILKQDKKLKEEELLTRNIIIGSLCFLLVFMIIGAVYILKSSREKRRVNQLLAIKSLRGQMNPHFIFNALNSVNHYISQNDERAANKYLSDFSKLMRSVMETSKHDLISLSEELEILKLYLQLEHARFKDNFDYSLEVDPEIDTAEFELPPMIIQPFIENAVWHGLRYTDSKGFLKIQIEQDDVALLVSIRDNGIGRKKSLELKTKNQKLQNSTGMQNIENRIKIMNELFNTHIVAEISDAFPDKENKGTSVKLVIPKKINNHA
jgi:tetratricopeptide (TPR) repeat protein